MKRSIYLMIVISLLIFAWSASSLAADKIGFINLREIMDNSNAGKKASDDVKKFVDKASKEIKDAEKDLTKMKDELEKQSSIMTQSSRNEKEAAYQKKLRDYKLLLNDMNEDLNKREQERLQKLMPGISKAIKVIAEKEKYTLILDVATMLIPYYAKENDISKRVIEDFNKMK
ncbi:MAG: OmpH family outer membrane protein [Deltaproteobacteria bacterium]|nr:OmpH family outer membrane protein [Deltaproteobacteria bacterium]